MRAYPHTRGATRSGVAEGLGFIPARAHRELSGSSPCWQASNILARQAPDISGMLPRRALSRPPENHDHPKTGDGIHKDPPQEGSAPVILGQQVGAISWRDDLQNNASDGRLPVASKGLSA